MRPLRLEMEKFEQEREKVLEEKERLEKLVETAMKDGGNGSRKQHQERKKKVDTAKNNLKIFLQESKTKLINLFPKQKLIEAFGWPPHSPDLNPIENLWGWIKNLVRSKYSSTEKLDQRCGQFIRELKSEKAVNVALRSIESFPARLMRCVLAGGDDFARVKLDPNQIPKLEWTEKMKK